MAATVTQLGERVLRRLGLALVAGADRAAAGPVVSVATVAARALRSYGVPTATADRPAIGTPLSRADVASLALKRLGINLADGVAYDATPVTVDAIANRALVRLEVLAAGEAPTSEDFNLASNEVQAVHGILAADALVPWAITGIPRFASELYAVMAAGLLASSFGRQANWAEGFDWARKELTRIAVSFTNGDALAEAEVTTVSQSLAERGTGWWADSAIPAAVSGDVAILVAARMAPIFGAPMDQPAADAVEARIGQAATIRSARQHAEEAVRSAIAELGLSGLAQFGADNIPAGAAEGLQALAVQALASDFGKQSDPAAVQAANQRLRLILLAGPIGQAIAEGHLWDVHADLDARGRARWSMADRPDTADFAYVQLAAYRMAPDAGVTPNPADVVQAEMAISRIIALPSSGERVVAEFF